MICPEKELKTISFESSDFEITNNVIAYTVEQYVGSINKSPESFDEVNDESEARLSAHIITVYIKKSLESELCSQTVADWCIWRIKNALKKTWGIE